MSRHILFWLFASSALAVTQAASEPLRPHAGTPSMQMHGVHDGGHRLAARGRRFGPAWGWPAYAVPSQDYPVALEAPPRIDLGESNYHCDYYDCTYSYHPLGRDPIGEPAPRLYVLAPNAKIISIDPDTGMPRNFDRPHDR